LGVAIQAPVLTEEAFVAADSRNHALTTWAPEGEPWAVVIALHGFNDYRHAFEKPGRYFSRNGVLVLAYDQRGFGEDARAGYWAKKEVLKSDLEAILDLARERYPGVPLFVLGESMGGAVALYTLAGREGAADGLILVAPAVWGWRPVNIIYKPALWLTAHIMPGKKFSGKNLRLEPTDNIDVLEAMSEDPYIIKKTRIDAIYGLSRIMKHGMKAAPEIRVPTYLVYGDKDDLVPVKMSRRLWDKLPEGMKTLKTYNYGYHMLLRDCKAAVVWRDILVFVAKTARRKIEISGVSKPVCQPSSSSE
jgi:alpha-beta hydrolase superfamily lysophospholipase